MKENEVKSTISEETHHQQQVTADDCRLFFGYS